MRGACHATSLGGGRGRRFDQPGLANSMGRKMVGRGTSLNEISSMWTSFNPPITMNDENDFYEDEDFEEHSSSLNFTENSEDQFNDEESESDYYQDNLLNY